MSSSAILITGVSRRIGAHLAAHFLHQGYVVLGSYRHPTPTLAQLITQGLIAVSADLTTQAGVDALIARAQTLTAPITAVIHNASIWPSDAQCQADPALRDALYRLHVSAPVDLTLGLQAACPAPEGKPSRSVIFITDAKTPAGDPRFIHYLASKSAAESAMRSLAIALAPHTRVNAIAPGLILFHPAVSAANRAQRLAQNLLPFEPGAEVIAQSVDYLLGCPAITGSTLTVDSGLHLRNPSAIDPTDECQP